MEGQPAYSCIDVDIVATEAGRGQVHPVLLVGPGTGGCMSSAHIPMV